MKTIYEMHVTIQEVKLHGFTKYFTVQGHINHHYFEKDFKSKKKARKWPVKKLKKLANELQT